SMAWGLELRVPFVDRKLVEVVSQIPARLRLARRKKILQEAVPELPEWVIRQPKRGFSLPFTQWLSEEWSDLVDHIDRASPVPLPPWYRRGSFLARETCRGRMNLPQDGISVPR